MDPQRAGLPTLAGVFGTAGLGVALTYTIPGLADLRPWLPGDPLPVVAALVPREAPRVVEDASGAPVEAAPVELPVVEAPPPTVNLPPRPPGVPTPLEDPEHRGMDPFFRALAATTAGSLARASQWGDSTIAADGITGTVRRRLQERFGNGGPGYLSAGLDPQWSMRPDVSVRREGTWETFSILNGGGEGRYGFGGIVSTASPEGSVSFYAPKLADGTRARMSRLEVWYQAAPERGGWWASVDGRGAGAGSALAEKRTDRHHVVEPKGGYTRVTIGASAEGSATFYGVVMETAGPGVVWDALGVVGVGTHSFGQQHRSHLKAQVARRAPHLVVVMIGGNETGAPTLKGDGTAWQPYFSTLLERLRAGAPEAGCLVVTPLDQGTREGGKPRSKPALKAMIDAQRAVAGQWGCAFWDARAAMGGEGSIVRWGQLSPPLAWTDLLHLSEEGQDIVGQMLADALLADYDAWLADGGPNRPKPAPPSLPATSPEVPPPPGNPPSAAPTAPEAP